MVRARWVALTAQPLPPAAARGPPRVPPRGQRRQEAPAGPGARRARECEGGRAGSAASAPSWVAGERHREPDSTGLGAPLFQPQQLWCQNVTLTWAPAVGRAQSIQRTRSRSAVRPAKPALASRRTSSRTQGVGIPCSPPREKQTNITTSTPRGLGIEHGLSTISTRKEPPRPNSQARWALSSKRSPASPLVLPRGNSSPCRLRRLEPLQLCDHGVPRLRQ